MQPAVRPAPDAYDQPFLTGDDNAPDLGGSRPHPAQRDACHDRQGHCPEARGQGHYRALCRRADFDTPDFVKNAAIEAIRSGQTKYTNVDGTAELKEAIAAKFRRDNDLEYTTGQISVNSGGKHTLFNALVATVDVGDEVIIPAPYWVSYPDIVNYCGGTPVIISAGANQLYKITPEQLEAAITPQTRWVLLNSPSNPTGAAYSARSCWRWARCCGATRMS